MKKFTLIIAIIGMVFTANAQQPIAYWTFDGNGDDLKAGKGYNAGLSAQGDVQYVEGLAGQAASFDGTSFFASAATTIGDGEDAIALTAWIKPTAYPSGENVGAAGIWEKDLMFRTLLLTDGRLQMVLATANFAWYTGVLETINAIPLNKWSHVAFVYNGSDVIIYINGVADIKASDLGVTVTGNVAVAGERGLNVCSNAGHETFVNLKGAVDDMMLFGDPINAAFVKALYDQYKPTAVDDLFSTEIKLYPNPAANNLVVENVGVNSKINIFTVTGQSVYNTVSGSEKLSVDVSSFQNGIYLIAIDNGTQKGVKKFTISK